MKFQFLVLDYSLLLCIKLSYSNVCVMAFKINLPICLTVIVTAISPKLFLA